MKHRNNLGILYIYMYVCMGVFIERVLEIRVRRNNDGEKKRVYESGRKREKLH